MAVIFGDKKKMVPVAMRMDQGEMRPDEGDYGVLKALSQELISAVKEDSAEKLAKVLKAIHHECEEYDEEE